MTPSLAADDRLQRRGGGVRAVAKVFPCSSPAGAGSGNFGVSATRLDEGDGAAISFANLLEDVKGSSRKESVCKFDGFYGIDATAGELYIGEVQHLVRGLFDGRSSCIISLAARGSSNTRLLQGAAGDPGLLSLSVAEILRMAKDIEASVSVSCYEYRHDRIFDLLENKGMEVLLLDDAERRIVLKNLSKVPIRSLSDFEKLYMNASSENTNIKRSAYEAALRSHFGLIIYLASHNDDSGKNLLAKISFMDLAGNEDTKASNSRSSLSINRPIHSLINVVCAINGDETYVNYRESKLTRILQDFLYDNGSGVLITCLNDICCQETIHAVNLASRSSQIMYRQHRLSTCGKSVSKLQTPSSTRKLDSSSKKSDLSLSTSIAKKSVPSSLINRRKISHVSATKNTPKKVSTALSGTKSVPHDFSSKEITFRNILADDNTKSEDSDFSRDLAETSQLEEVIVLKDITPNDATVPGVQKETCLQTSGDDFSGIEIEGASGDAVEELHIYAQPSTPKISEQLKEISNSLKIWSSKPICLPTVNADISRAHSNNTSIDRVEADSESANKFVGTPHDILKARSAGMKRTLTKDFLTFINSASKEQLKELKGIGERRATFILQLREETPEPFQDIEDLRSIGLTSNQIKSMMADIIKDV